jgi:hypothetical protein
MVRRGKARVRLFCPPGGTNCAGKIFLFAFHHRKGQMVAIAQAPFGSEGFSITSGKRGVVAIRLDRFTKARLANSPHHRFNARLTGRGVEFRTVLLKLAKKKRKRR